MRDANEVSGSVGRIGLACAGGVVEGAFYEVGVLCALEDAIDGLELNRLDAYVGVSAGAVVVAGLANGITPRTMSLAVVERAGPELDLRPDRLFVPALGAQARRLARLPGVLASSLLHHFSRSRERSLLGALMKVTEAIPLCLLDNRPLERFLARALSTSGRTNDFRELRTALRIVAVNLDTSQTVAFGDEATAHIPISLAVQASTALPLLFCPVEIEGEHYIDGVARRTVHASQALAQGVGLLFCINPIVPIDLHAVRPDEPPRRSSLVEYGLPAVLSQTFRTMIHSRMQVGMEGYRHTYPDADVILIEPEPSDHSLFFSNIFSFSNRHRVCEHAYQTTRAYLLRESGRIQPILRRHGLTLRRDVLLDPARVLFREDEEPGPAPDPAAAGSRETHAALHRLDEALDRLEAGLD